MKPLSVHISDDFSHLFILLFASQGREADTDPNDNANGAHARILHSQEDASETSASHTMANNLVSRQCRLCNDLETG